MSVYLIYSRIYQANGEGLYKIFWDVLYILYMALQLPPSCGATQAISEETLCIEVGLEAIEVSCFSFLVMF